MTSVLSIGARIDCEHTFMTQKKSFKDLSQGQRTLIIVLTAIDVVAKALAVRDIRKRSGDQVRGPKALWFALQALNFIGPAAWFTLGRRND